MRHYDVTVTPEAEADLAALCDYVSVTLGMPRAAASRLRELRATVASLQTMPARARVLEGSPWEGLGVRRIQSKGVHVYYDVSEEAGEVRVLGVLPARGGDLLMEGRLGGDERGR